MISDIPQAFQYSFFPLIGTKKKFKIIPIGGLQMMNYAAMFMDNEDIEGVTGLEDRMCILFVKFTKSQCDAIVKKATKLFDEGERALIESENQTDITTLIE